MTADQRQKPTYDRPAHAALWPYMQRAIAAAIEGNDTDDQVEELCLRYLTPSPPAPECGECGDTLTNLDTGKPCDACAQEIREIGEWQRDMTGRGR